MAAVTASGPRPTFLRETSLLCVRFLLVVSLSATCLHASTAPYDDNNLNLQAAQSGPHARFEPAAESSPVDLLGADPGFNLTQYVPHEMRIAPINPAFQTANGSELEAAAANRSSGGESGEAGGSSYGPLSKQIRFGGPVLIGNPFIEVFVIFYGAWANVVEKNIILTFIK